MDAPPPIIHEVLPLEMLGAIFEEHAKLEWIAPMIDGRVCRLWRQVVLNTPRAWAYLEIDEDKRPGIWSLTSWLDRSGGAPLHIDVDMDYTPDRHINKRTLYDLVGDHYKRIASLRMDRGDQSFFEGREFPCLQLLDVENWFPTHFPSTLSRGRMPALRSLRLGATDLSAVPLSILASFTVLVLHSRSFISLPERFNSLTRLMLDDVRLGGPLSGPVAFPSLIYLSLYNVNGLKPHINAPCLITYHEGGRTQIESFSAPLLSLIEYGVYGLRADSSHLGEWHLLFPNILRLSLRAGQHELFSWLDSLSNQPHLLPALQTISVGDSHEGPIPETVQRDMEDLVRIRGKACGINVVLSFEARPIFRIPIFFGAVSGFFIRWPCTLLTQTLGWRRSLVTAVWFQVFTHSHSPRTAR